MKPLYLIAALSCLNLWSITSSAQQFKPVCKDTVTCCKDSMQMLNEVCITSKYYKKYKIDRSSVSLKLTTPLLQLPQNVQEIDKTILADQQVININESVTRNVSGALRNNTAEFYGPFIFMRGAAINTLRNGVDLSMIYYGPTPEDAGIISRLEFIKGPAGFVNSIGDPAGSFNLVTKQPSGIATNNFAFTTGSFGLYRVTADLDGNIGQSKKWQYRLNAVGQLANSFQKYAFNNKALIDPVLRYNLNAHSSITGEYLYQRQSFRQYLLTVFSPYGFGSLPADFSITDPNKNPVKATENNAFLTYTNNFNKEWQLTAKATFAQDNLDGNYFFVSAFNKATPTLLPRRVTYERFYTNVYSFQTFMNGEFQTGDLLHRLTAGLDINSKNLLAYSGYNDKAANPALYPLDPDNPVYGITFDSNERSGSLADIATNRSAVRYYAAFAQDELHFFNDRLRLTLAARVTSAKSSVIVPTVTAVSNVVLTPRFGLNYSFDHEFSAYALFDETFTPQAGISAAGGVFEPLKGKNIEAGLKKDWLGGRWNTTLSIYQIDRSNIIVTDPATNLQSQIGQTRTKGIEFDLKGEIVTGLNAVINYAFTDSYITKDANAALVGLPSPYRVKHIQNTWLNYRLPFRSLGCFTVSGGYQLQTGRAGRYPQEDNLNIAPIFRLDGGIGWSNQRFSVNGIINNILNRMNYGSAWITPVATKPTTGLYAYVPYPPREFRITLGYSF